MEDDALQVGAQGVRVDSDGRERTMEAERLQRDRGTVAWATSPHLRRHWENLGLLGSGILALVLTTWRLTDNGYANLYYAVAVKSMAANGHAFFFASLDPGGFVSIDKPPLGFWLQVLSVRMFGFSPLALLLPQALAGAVAAPLLGIVVRRSFGWAVGLLAAIALALTPIWVVSARDNIVDVQLALVLVLAAIALLKAIFMSANSARWKGTSGYFWRNTADVAWLTLAFGLIGIGFNIKMLEAFLVVPAFAFTYLVCSGRSLPQRLAALLLALIVMVGVSLAWVEVVDLTPPQQRPYVGSTVTNSEFDLAFGYNGLSRLLGRRVNADTPLQFTAPEPSTRVGEAGVFRFLQPELGSQASWLLPLALLGLIAAWPFAPIEGRARGSGWRATLDAHLGAVVHAVTAGPTGGRARQAAGYTLWTSWLLSGLAFFSVARAIDAYYLVVLVPAICATASIGASALWRAYTAPCWRGWLFPVAVGATFLEQAYLLGVAPKWEHWLASVLVVVGVLSGLGLAILRLRAGYGVPKGNSGYGRFERIGGVGGRRVAPSSLSDQTVPRHRMLVGAVSMALVAACLVAPTLWTLSSLTYGNANTHPIAGPRYARAGSLARPRVDTHLLAYLAAHRNGAYYLVGARDSIATTPLIFYTSTPIMTVGGYSGNDPILTIDALQQFIKANVVRLFLLPANDVTLKERAALYAAMFNGKKGVLPGPAFHSSGSLYYWIATHCSPIPPPQWSSDPGASRRLGTYELFDCSSLVTANVGAGGKAVATAWTSGRSFF